ncbi:Zinc finger, CCHC-type [Corchorus capsularis]|uniref:Zinc finger, CCHC-type n=1 Tax=Corchorus capsularis TaxID=210143 RepID=A0A1R3JH67_COCAP|nr:Zinc finger, CCHC-type [Corchorus capsularis]
MFANDVGLHAENELLGVENQHLGPGLGENDAKKVNLGPADGENQNGPLQNANGGLENGLGGKDADINAQDVAEIHVEEFSNRCAYFDHVEKDNSDDEDPQIQYARSQFETVRDKMLDEFERNGFSLPGFRPIDAAEEVSGLENEAGPSNNFNPEEPYYSTDELGDFDSDDDATRNPTEDIEKTPVRQYCRAFLSTDERCDMIDNNMCEAFNGTLLKARKLPVISLFEQIRRRMMVRIAEKRKECTRWKGNLGPNIWKIINKNVDIADKCLVYGNGADGYEILHGEEQFVVHLDNKTCSCRRYTHSGIPCAHAICAIRHKKTNIEDYVSSWYYKEVYELAYGFPLEPLKGLEDWPTIDGEHEQVHPPAYRRKPGRPKLARRKGAHENESNNKPKPAPTKMSRKGTVMTCQNCHQTGHNKRGCPKTNSGNEGASIAETNPTNIPANPLNMPTDLPEEVETSHPQSSSRTKLHPKKKKANVAATVSAAQAAATAEVNYTGQLGIGNATFTANFSSSNDVGSSGNATVNITSAQQVPETVPDNVLETSKRKAMVANASKAKAAAKAKGKTKGKPPRVSGKVVLDESGKVLSTTEPNFRTSPKSKAKLFGNVQGGSASTCNNPTPTPTPTPNWFETVSSASTGGLQQASTSNKRPRMEGYGVYTNPQGMQIEDVGLITQRVHKIVNKKSKSSSEVHGTQESNNSDLDGLIPRSRNNGGLESVWAETNTANPIGMTIVFLDGVFAFSKGILKLDGSVARSRHDLWLSIEKATESKSLVWPTKRRSEVPTLKSQRRSSPS